MTDLFTGYRNNIYKVDDKEEKMDEPFLFVGLDYEKPEEVLAFAKELAEVKGEFGFKLNLDFIINAAFSGNSHLRKVLDLGKETFVDLKMWNGRRTMVSIVNDLIKVGVDYTNVYAEAGEPFVRAVVDTTKEKRTKILGLTVLTHYDDEHCQRNYGCSLREAIRRFSKIAHSAGCHGIIVPGTMLNEVRDLEIEKLVPAVRPDWFGITGDNYQRQEALIREAIEGGANLLVCSSPIRRGYNGSRRDALLKTLEEIERYSQ